MATRRGPFSEAIPDKDFSQFENGAPNDDRAQTFSGLLVHIFNNLRPPACTPLPAGARFATL